MHILTNNLRNKCTQVMAFGQLIKHNMKNIFLERLYTKWGRQTIARPFIKNQNWTYLWINSLKFYTVYFYCMAIWGLSKYFETKMRTTCFYHIQNISKIQKVVWNYSLCLIFCMVFEEKYFPCHTLLTYWILLCGCFTLCEIW